MLPFISVIIPAHQAQKYISEAIASVLAQKWQGKIEIIVIDDGSIDDTAAVAESLGAIVIRKSQGGAASARNEGLRAAKGDLVLLLDADDHYTNDAIKTMYSAMVDSDADVVFAMAEDFISPELTEQQKAQLKPRECAYSGVLPGCSLIRRDVFDAIGLFDDSMKSGETVAWLLKLRDAKIHTIQIPDVTLKRRLHLTNTGRTQQKQEMANYAALLRKRMMNKQ